MGRDDGFRVADLDVGLLDDPKVRALVRATDEPTAARALVGYLAALTASWARGERVTLGDAAPLWLRIDDVAPALAAAGLLDADGRIPVKAWDSWFGPAHERRERYRELGSRGGRASHRAEPERTVERTPERTVEPVRPYRPSDRSDRRAHAREMAPLGAVLRMEGRSEAVDPATCSHPSSDEIVVGNGRSARRCVRCGALDVTTIDCRDYSAHRDHHVKADGAWRCLACHPTAPAGTVPADVPPRRPADASPPSAGTSHGGSP